MSHPEQAKGVGNLEFRWGKKQSSGSTEDFQYYESFTYDGVEYLLYDSVYIWRAGELEPYIGKLIKMWEEVANHKKLVKVVWFLRPNETRHHLRGLKPGNKEIFLACGEGKGLTNMNPLEAISGKCHVVCTSEDGRNPRASSEELRIADHIFCRTFNVGNCSISEKFPNVIAGVKVEYLFNKRKDQKLIHPPKLEGNLNKRSRQSTLSSEFEAHATDLKAVKDRQSWRSRHQNEKEAKIPAPSLGKQTYSTYKSTMISGATKISGNQVGNKAKVRCPEDILPESGSDVCLLKKRKLQDIPGGLKEGTDICEKRQSTKSENFNTKTCKTPEEGDCQIEKCKSVTDPQVASTRRPVMDSSNWFKQLSWEEQIQKAHGAGSLILLDNLNPSYSSSEIEDVVWDAFKKKVSAKMIQQRKFSSPLYGQALVVFKSKDDADFALSELNTRCLIVGVRPVVGRRVNLVETGKSSTFAGHLTIEKSRFQKQSSDWRKAVSTSHCSQPNTLEFEMAMEWRVLQERERISMSALHEQQAKEIADLKRREKAPLHKHISMGAAKK